MHFNTKEHKNELNVYYVCQPQESLLTKEKSRLIYVWVYFTVKN